jgi:hypothetical protein
MRSLHSGWVLRNAAFPLVSRFQGASNRAPPSPRRCLLRPLAPEENLSAPPARYTRTPNLVAISRLP